MDEKNRFDSLFREILMLDPEETLETVEMLTAPCWNSMEHMTLITALEDAFDLRLEPEEIMGLTSYEKGLALLRKHGVNL